MNQHDELCPIARKSAHGVPTGVSSRSNTSLGAAATSPPLLLALRRRAEVRSARPAASPEASTAMAHSRNTSCFMVRQQRQQRGWRRRQRASEDEQTSRRLGAAKPNREGCYCPVDVTAVKPESRRFAHQITLRPLPFPKKARSGGQIVENFGARGEKKIGGQIVGKN